RIRSAANSRAPRSAASITASMATSNDSPGSGAQPSNRMPRSRSAASPSRLTRSQISITAARSRSNSARFSPRRDSGDSRHDLVSNLLTVTSGSLPQPGDDRLDRVGPGLQAGLVGDEPCRRRPEHSDHPQAVLAQRPAGGGEVDDAVDKADLRSQLDRAVQ